MRPDRPDIAIPPIPAGTEWIGEAVETIERVTAARPLVVHFFDFAQLNSIRALPYLLAWHERYGDELAFIGVHSPRFPFTRDGAAVADAVKRLGISWPVALDPGFTTWRLYEPHGWPALFLWGRGGALRWYHPGEGEYAATEETIRTEIAGGGGEREWPPLLEPMRPSDVPGVKVIAPTPELFPGGSIEDPWIATEEEPVLTLPYEAGGAYAAADGAGEIGVRVDGEQRDPVAVEHPGLVELTSHETTERHQLALEVSPGIRIHSIQFEPALP